MNNVEQLEMVRLRAAVNANVEDAAVWRWFADLMEDNRVACQRRNASWSITVDGQPLSSNTSFDSAIRTAYTMARAMSAMKMPDRVDADAA